MKLGIMDRFVRSKGRYRLDEPQEIQRKFTRRRGFATRKALPSGTFSFMGSSNEQT